MKESLKVLTKIAILNFIILTFFVVVGKLPSNLPQKQTTTDSALQITPTQKIIQDAQNGSATDEPTKPISISTLAPSSQPATPTTDSMQISAHSLRTDCWVSFEGHIYDITSYFGSHPGGDDVLLKYCGKDISQAFATKDRNPPQPHSGAAKEILNQFLIK